MYFIIFIASSCIFNFQSALCLHNYLIDTGRLSHSIVDYGRKNEQNGKWRLAGEMRQINCLTRKKANRARNEAVQVRNILADFFRVKLD